MNTQHNLILIDGSWLIHRSFHAFRNLSVKLRSGSVASTGHLYGVMKALRQITNAYPVSDIIFCLDGDSTHGKTLDPEYKAHRGHGDSWSPFDDLGVLINMILSYPHTQIAFHKDLEADEIISYYVRLNDGKYGNGVSIYIHSMDNDMLQLLGDGVFIAKSFADGRFVTTDEDEYLNDPKYFDKFASTKIEALPLFRALTGDPSDNLAGFPRLRRKQAKEWAEEYLTATALADDAVRRPGKFPDGFIEFLPKLKTNFEIMRLPTPSDLSARGQLPRLFGDRTNSDALFNLYQMRSMTPNIIPLVEVTDDIEREWIALRDSLNAQWKHPNSNK